MDAAQLTRQDEAFVKTTAGGLNDELKVVNALLELSDRLEGKGGFPIGRASQNCLTMINTSSRSAAGVGSQRFPSNVSGMSGAAGLRSTSASNSSTRSWRTTRRRTRCSAMPLEMTTVRKAKASLRPRSLGADVARTKTRTSCLPRFTPVYAQEYRAKKKINELKQMRQFFKGGNTEETKTWVKEQQTKEPRKSHAFCARSWDNEVGNGPGDLPRRVEKPFMQFTLLWEIPSQSLDTGAFSKPWQEIQRSQVSARGSQQTVWLLRDHASG